MKNELVLDKLSFINLIIRSIKIIKNWTTVSYDQKVNEYALLENSINDKIAELNNEIDQLEAQKDIIENLSDDLFEEHMKHFK